MEKMRNEIKNYLKKNQYKYYTINDYVKKKVNSVLFKKKNINKLIENIPVLVENTILGNEWVLLLCSKVTNKEYIIDCLIDALKDVEYEFHSSLRITKLFDKLELTDQQKSDLLDILEHKKNGFDYKLVSWLDSSILEDNNHLRVDLCKKLLEDRKYIYLFTNWYGYTDERKNFVSQNIDLLLKGNDIADLYILKKLVSDNDESVSKIKNKINEDREHALKTLFYSCDKFFYNGNQKGWIEEHTVLFEVFCLMIKDICKNELVDVSDINILSSGQYSVAYEIGNKIFKIGRERGFNSFPNNPYIIAPLLRKEFHDGEFSTFVEVTEKADTKSKITNEELYQLYKKVRDINLVWYDIHSGNVGRLLKDNTIHWHQELPITPEVLGLDKYRGSELLKKGDVVIIDNDLIVDEESFFNSSCTMSRIFLEFEERYQKEKIKKLVI